MAVIEQITSKPAGSYITLIAKAFVGFVVASAKSMIVRTESVLDVKFLRLAAKMKYIAGAFYLSCSLTIHSCVLN